MEDKGVGKGSNKYEVNQRPPLPLRTQNRGKSHRSFPKPVIVTKFKFSLSLFTGLDGHH